MEREASVKLTLNNSQFVVSIKQAGDEVEETGKKGKKAGKALSDGFAGAKSALGGLAGKAKEVIGIAGGLAAAFSLSTAVQQSLSLRERFRDLEFAINKTGKTIDGQAADWESLQGAARDAGRETGQTVNDMEAALNHLFTKTGDADFAVGALEIVGHAASTTGDKLESMADVAQVLQRKFGATLETLPEMMGVFVEKTGAGGPALEELGSKFALMAGEAHAAGFRGKEGLAQLLGVMREMGPEVGEKMEPAMKKLFALFRDGSKDLKALSKESGIKFDENSSGMDKFRKMLGSEKGRATLQAKLGGEARIVFDQLAKPFQDAFDEAKKSGSKTKDATQKGLEAWDKSMKEMSKSTIDYQRLVSESKAGQAEDPAKRLEMAMEDFTEAIATPEMFDAIDTLAENLPALASAIAEFTSFVVKNPLLAGGLAVGASAGGGFLKSAGSTVAVELGSKVKDKAIKAFEPVGTKIAERAAASLAAHPGMAMAGKAMGVAAAAYIGYEIGKHLVDSRMETKDKNQGDIVMGGVEAHAAGLSGDKARMRAARKDLKEKIKKMEEDQGGIGGKFDTLMGGLATIMPGGDPNFRSPEQRMLSDAKLDLQRLEKQINATEKAPAVAPEQAPGARPAAGGGRNGITQQARQQRVKIDDIDELGRSNARFLSNTVLRVKVEGAAPDGSRGPLMPPAPGT